MSEVITTESATKVAVTFEVKLGLKNYSNVMARAWVEQNVGEEGEAFSLARAALAAREAVEGALADFGGIDAVVPTVTATRKERNGDETPISIDEAVALVEEQLGGEVVTFPTPSPATPPALRVKGQQHGDLPSWLLTAAAEEGVTEVYDNRDSATVENRRPFFKATTGGRDAKAFWPPKQRRQG